MESSTKGKNKAVVAGPRDIIPSAQEMHLPLRIGAVRYVVA